jgi:hypothetical protein
MALVLLLLSSKVIDHITRMARIDKRIQIAYWHFQFSNRSTQDLANMLRSIIRQLVRCPLPQSIRDLCEKHEGPGSEPSLGELTEALMNIMRISGRKTYLIIDALDECPDEGPQARGKLLDIIKHLANKEQKSVHMIVTSRREPDIRQTLEPIATCMLDVESLLKNDVKMFVESAFSHELLRRWGEELRSLATERLLSHDGRQVSRYAGIFSDFACRQFRWADLQVTRLKGCPTAEHFRTALNTIPETLEATYHQALASIGKVYRRQVLQILIWLTTTFRELRSEEVAAVVGFNSADDVLRICKSIMVTVMDNGKGYIIRLAHYSVKEFLLVRHVQQRNQYWYQFTMDTAHYQITNKILECVFEKTNQPHAARLRRYIAHYWPNHSRQNSGTAEWTILQARIDNLLTDENRELLLHWTLIDDDEYEDPMHAVCRPLYYACMLGLMRSVIKYWGDDPEIIQEGHAGNALAAAFLNGHDDIFRWLAPRCGDISGMIRLEDVLLRLTHSKHVRRDSFEA